MELIIFSGNYMYATDIIFEIAILIFLFLICVSILMISLHYIRLLLKYLYLKLYPFKTAQIVPIPLAKVVNRGTNNSINQYVVEVDIKEVNVIS